MSLVEAANNMMPFRIEMEDEVERRRIEDNLSYRNIGHELYSLAHAYGLKDIASRYIEEAADA